MKSTKRSLFASVLALVLCVCMLLGTTWAWFTDEVQSGVNQIKAGNLDVELYAGNEKVTEATKLFDDVALWEPGAYCYETFTIKNVGNLAFKYSMLINAYNATEVNGNSLDEVLKVAVVDTAPTGRQTYADAAPLKGWSLGYNELPLYPLGNVPDGGASEKTFTVVVYWEPTDHDNDYNMNNGNKGNTLSVDLGVTLVATQLTYEKDSFDDQYDLSAKLPVLATFPSISQEDITNGEKSVEIEKQGAIESASVPTTGAATVFNELKKADTEDTKYNNDLVLTLNVNETANKEKVVEGGKEKTIDLDISMSAVMTVTNAATKKVVETNKKDDVKTLDTYSEIKLQIGAGLNSVTVNHDGKPMHNNMAEDSDKVGYFSYDRVSGILSLNTMTFSPFTIMYSTKCDHNFLPQSIVAATCCRNGEKTYKCSECGFISKETIPMTNKCNCSIDHSSYIEGVWCNYCHHVVPFIEGPYTKDMLKTIPEEMISGSTVMWPTGNNNIVEIPLEYMYLGYVDEYGAINVPSGSFTNISPAVLYIFKSFPDGGYGYNYIDTEKYREDVDETGNTVYIKDENGTETKESIMYKYTDWYADYIISFNNDIVGQSCGIVGSYGGMAFGVDLPALKKGEEVGLLATMSQTRTYGRIASGDERNFVCGFYNLSDDNVINGTKIIVKLMLTDPNDSSNKVLCSYTEYAITDASYPAYHPNYPTAN